MSLRPLAASLSLLFVPALPLAAQDTPPPRAVPVEMYDKDGNFAPLPDKADRDALLRIQIYLDENNFGPGHLDGKIGEFGKKAASVYNQIHGVPVGNYFRLIKASKERVPNLQTTYTIREDDLKHVTPGLPTKPQDQAKVKYMGYRSLAELVAERYHTSEEFLTAINPGKSIYNFRPGSVVNVPNVTPYEIEAWPKYKKYETDAALSQNSVVVDIRARVAIFFDAENRPFASFPITPGRPKFIQFGEWKITNMVTTPEFRWDKSMLEDGKRSDTYYQIPIGPNSPVGIMWCGTSRSGIGLHGTATPHSIGRGESAGCIRFANWDAARLPKLLSPGSMVVIR